MEAVFLKVLLLVPWHAVARQVLWINIICMDGMGVREWN